MWTIEQVRDLIQNVPSYIAQANKLSMRWFNYEISSDRLVEQTMDGWAENGFGLWALEVLATG